MSAVDPSPAVAPAALTPAATATALTPDALRAHWQGHRGLTRRVIAAFPEDQFGTFAVGGMRPFAALTAELLAIGVPMLREMVTGASTPFADAPLPSRDEALRRWDEDTAELDALWARLDPARFPERHVAFGQYEGTVVGNLLYAIDNEIHHRGQGFVYLRALGIEPPPFWDRG